MRRGIDSRIPDDRSKLLERYFCRSDQLLFRKKRLPR
jgi:hypothetical protein